MGCSIGVSAKNGAAKSGAHDVNYTMVMYSNATIPKYNYRSCSFSTDVAMFTSGLARVFDFEGFCSPPKTGGCTMTSNFSLLCQCGCMGDVPDRGCLFNWNATVNISSA